MKRIGTLLLSCLALISAFALVVGHAATLEVRGGVAQTFRFEVVSPAAPVDLLVEVREYAGNSTNLTAVRTVGPFRLRSDQSYHLAYEDGRLRDCPASLGLSEPRTGGPFTPPPDLTHVLCVQRSQDGTVVVRVEAPDGPIVGPS